MTINLKVNQDKPKGFTVNDIKGGSFLSKAIMFGLFTRIQVQAKFS